MSDFSISISCICTNVIGNEIIGELPVNNFKLKYFAETLQQSNYMDITHIRNSVPSR